MKITLIHGQNHKGSTYHIGRMLAEKLGGEITEFFLPRDFGEFCVGCTSCFARAESLCPHYEKLAPITRAMDEGDILIFTSPVYVFSCGRLYESLPGSLWVSLDGAPAGRRDVYQTGGVCIYSSGRRHEIYK